MKEKKSREGFSSVLLAIMVTLGSAIGLGNIWKFPYLTGTGGGGAFLVIYLLFIVVVGIPVMTAEFVIGRRSRLNAVGSFRVLEKKKKTLWSVVGFFGALSSYLVMFFYTAVAGWVYSYIFRTLTGGFVGVNGETVGEIFNNAIGAGTAGGSFFSSAVLTPVFWQIFALLIIGLIISKGLSKGIESTVKYMMPALFILLIVCVIRALALPGAAAGLRFLFHVDFSQVTPNVVLTAMGLAFFKLSLGMGVMITYGSYYTNEVDLTKAPLPIAFGDLAVSMLAGLAIFPTVFSFGLEPGAGPGLLFITIPLVFSQMPFGQVLLFVFFLLTAFAANGALLSLLEVPTLWFAEEFSLSRKQSALINCIIIGFFGILAGLSADGTALLGFVKIFGKGIFDFYDYLSSNIIMTLGGILVCYYVGYRMKKEDFVDELTNHGTLNNEVKVNFIRFLCRYITPVLIIVIVLNSFGIIKF